MNEPDAEKVMRHLTRSGKKEVYWAFEVASLSTLLKGKRMKKIEYAVVEHRELIESHGWTVDEFLAMLREPL